MANAKQQAAAPAAETVPPMTKAEHEVALDAAIVAEDAAKRDLYMLKYRHAMGWPDMHKILAEAEQVLDNAVAELRKLMGHPAASPPASLNDKNP